ncbi:MAG: response regulator transcription factor [Hyphomicrobiales bacterium]|nr:response regulator transcription factor [Hyphomicrobiales bacterium]
MKPPISILVVDDEPQIRKFLRISLNAHGYDVVEAGRGEDGIKTFALENPALVILDLGLPDIDGLQVVRRIREWSETPILVLSVRASEEDKIQALDNGANDYVVKPFGVGELLARVRAALRLKEFAKTEASEITVGDLAIDLAQRKVRRADAEIRLTRKEFDILRVLARNAGRIVTHQQMLRTIWGPAQEQETHYLRVYVGHLRQKLGDDPANPRYIENEPGVGYRLMA